MPVGLEPADRRFLIICGALFVAATALALLAGQSSGEASPNYASSYSAASDGGEAAYLLLGELGYQIERWSQPPTNLPSSRGVVLVLADPFLPASSEEQLALRSFASGGGTVLVTGVNGARLLGETGAGPKPATAQAWQRFTAEAPSAITRGAAEITMRGDTRWEAARPEQQRVYGDHNGAIVVTRPLGAGQIVWWADASPLTNYGLTQASNLELFLNSVAPSQAATQRKRGSEGGPEARVGWTRAPVRVLWDEYFHGERAGFWSYVGRTPVPWFLLQAALILAAALITYGRLVGTVRPLIHESRLSPLEFVETLGDLYQRKRASAGILEVAYQRFRRLTLRRFDLPLTASVDDVDRCVRDRLGRTPPGFRETLHQCESGSRDLAQRDSESLRLIQKLHDHARDFGLDH
jgi:Domain of unknown function (DUF4350)